MNRKPVFWLLVLGLLFATSVSAEGGNQVERGAAIYKMYCITCHGDEGRGLTPEWIAQWPKDHQWCSNPKCHGTKGGEAGFVIREKEVPPVIGPGTLTKFSTAQDMFAFIRARMPLSAPGRLSDDEYWAVEAYLLHWNGFLDEGTVVDPVTASQIRIGAAPVNPRATETPVVTVAASIPMNEGPGWAVFPTIAGTGGLVFIACLAWRLRRKNN